MIAPDMETALMECVLAKMDGEVMTVPDVAQETDKDAVVMENVLRANAIATQDFPDMPAMSELVCMTALNMVIVPTELACAKKDTVDGIARFHQNHNHANAPFIASEDVCHNVPRFMKRKEPDHRMNATPSALKSVFHNALLERCQSA